MRLYSKYYVQAFCVSRKFVFSAQENTTGKIVKTTFAHNYEAFEFYIPWLQALFTGDSGLTLKLIYFFQKT